MYLISKDRKLLESWQAEVDKELGYPEDVSTFRQVGAGIHAPLGLGRALHFAEIETDQTGTQFALPFSDAVPVPKGTETVEALPKDWYPADELSGQE